MITRKFFVVFFTVMVILSLSGLSSVGADTVDGEAIGDSHEYVETGPDYAVIEKSVYHELHDGAKISDSADGTVTATSDDGTISLSLDSDIALKGSVKKDATAVLSGLVRAEGSRNMSTGELVVNTAISSAVKLTPGTKGSAEGKVTASGEAEAMNSGDGLPELYAEVEGSTMATGTAKSSAPSGLVAGGIIYSFVDAPLYTIPSYHLKSAIDSDVNGYGTSSGAASASGTARAYILTEEEGLYTGAEGSTSAAASGKGNGKTYATATTESEIYSNENGYDSKTSIHTSAIAEGFATGFKGSVQASAATPPESSPFPVVFGNPVPALPTGNYAIQTSLLDDFSSLSQLNENGGIEGDRISEVSVEGNSASSAYTQQVGETLAFTDISAVYVYPNTETYSNELNFDDLLHVSYSLSSEYFDQSIIWNAVSSQGESGGFSGKAAAMAEGSAFTLAENESDEPFWYSDTFAAGTTSGTATSTGTGMAGGQTSIESVNLVDVNYGTISIGSEGIPLADMNLTLPELEMPDDNLLPLDAIPMQVENGIPHEIPIPDIPAFKFGTTIPERALVEISSITSDATAYGRARKDTAAASTSASGFTFAIGYRYDPPLVTGDPGCSVVSGTSAGGNTSAMASAQQKSDPSSIAGIIAVSSPYASDLAQSGQSLDAALIGTVSFADGIRGRTAGMAEGDAAAGSYITYDVFDYQGPDPANITGEAYSSAEANGGTGISAGGIGAGAYYQFYDEEVTDTFSVSAAMIGSASAALGTARATSGAEGMGTANSRSEFDVNGEILASTTNGAGLSGSIETSAKTVNGIAGAVDGIITGQYVSAYTDQTSEGSGEIIGGSLIADTVFAQRSGKSGLAEASAMAGGEAYTGGDFYAIIDGIEDPVAARSAAGVVGEIGGDASVKCGDPLSASVIMAFADANGGNSEGIPHGNTYAAGLILSGSVASGQCARTTGYADGSTIAGSELNYNGTLVEGNSYNASSFAELHGSTGSIASSTSASTLALGLGFDGVSSSAEFYEGEGDSIVVGDPDGAPWPSFFDLAIKGSVAAVLGDGKASSCATLSSAVAESSVDGSDGEGIFEKVYGNVTASGDAVAEVKSKGGIGIGAAIEGSGVFIEAEPNPEAAPDTDITAFSGLASIAFAEGDDPKDTVSAHSGVSGTTSAFGYMSSPDAYVDQYTNATGDVTADVLANKVTDPLGGSIILSYGKSELAGLNAISHTYDATLIATTILVEGYKAEGSAAAGGDALAGGLILDPATSNLTSSTGQTVGVFSSDVNVYDGAAIAVSGAGSSSSAMDDRISGFSEVRNMNVIGSYAAGEGCSVKASAWYDAGSSAWSTKVPPDMPIGYTGVAGDGSSSIAARKSAAKGISLGIAYQEASEGPGIPQTVFSGAGFGTFAAATDDAKSTVASASMSDVAMYAYAQNLTQYSHVEYEGGVSYITLDPDGNPRIIWDTYATHVLTDGVYEKSGDDHVYDTLTDPNYGIWYKYAMASDVPLPPAPVPGDILPYLIDS